jgi:small conductance mechanosensitive channel
VGDVFKDLVQGWGKTLLKEIPHIIQALLVLAITLYAAGRLQRTVERISGLDHRRRELARLLGRLVRIAVFVCGLLIVVSIFDQTRLLASFIASLGIFGLLVAFALQDITKNFAAGVLLLIQRPFGLDDRIRIGANEGVVTDISLRATVLRTIEGHEVLIPNADVFSSTIINLTRYPVRRHSVVVTLPLDADAQASRERLEAALRGVPGLEHEPQPHIASTAVGKDDQQFEARFWIKSAAPETPAIISAVTLALQEAVRTLRAARTQMAEVSSQKNDTISA